MKTPPDRLWDLLADRALDGLADREEAELAELLARHPEVDPDTLDRTAAALEVTAHAPTKLPPRLRTALIALAPAQPAGRVAPAPPPARTADARWRAAWGWAGWVTAAACILWIAATTPTAEKAGIGPTVAHNPVSTRHPAGDEVVFALTAQEAKSRASGSVVWSPDRQEGELQVVRMTPNDAKVEQYQLWVVDESRPESTPVPCQVFDVFRGVDSGAQLLRFRPALKVGKAVRFFITREPAGGVVVPDPSKSVLGSQARRPVSLDPRDRPCWRGGAVAGQRDDAWLNAMAQAADAPLSL